MFERTIERMRRKAERRAEARVLELTERLRAELPAGIETGATGGGVRLTGRGLRRRFALDPELRWMRLK